MTDRAYDILKAVHAAHNFRKQAPLLSETLTYIDRRTGKEMEFALGDLAFLSFRTGEPAKNSSCDTYLYKICDENGIERFYMHALRHTYATRAIENGMPPKTLQKLLGHAGIKMPMDGYVHVINKSLAEGCGNLSRGSVLTIYLIRSREVAAPKNRTARRKWCKSHSPNAANP